MTKYGRVMTYVAAVLFLSASAPEARPHEEVKGGGLQFLLGLSDDQASSWTQENEGYKAKLQSLHERRKDAGETIERAVAASNRSELGQALLAAWDIDQETSAERRAHNDRLKALLTAEQAEKLKLVHEVAEVMHFSPAALEETLLNGGGERPHRGVAGGETIAHERGEMRELRHRKSEP
jgi:hypothetical protein